MTLAKLFGSEEEHRIIISAQNSWDL